MKKLRKQKVAGRPLPLNNSRKSDWAYQHVFLPHVVPQALEPRLELLVLRVERAREEAATTGDCGRTLSTTDLRLRAELLRPFEAVARLADPLAATRLLVATLRFPVVFLAAFLLAGFLAADFLATFLAVDFLATFFFATFLLAVFLAADFLATFLAAGFLAALRLAVVFLATLRLAVVLRALVRFTAFLAGERLTLRRFVEADARRLLRLNMALPPILVILAIAYWIYRQSDRETLVKK